MSAMAMRPWPLPWALGAGIVAAAVGTIVPRATLAAALAVAALALLALWLLRRPGGWVGPFLFACICLPPLPIALGNAGPHPALAFAAVGLVAGIALVGRGAAPLPRSVAAMLLYPLALVASLPFAFWFSGPALGAATLARIGLFGVAIYVLLYTAAEADASHADDARRLRALLWAATASAAFACLDFLLQLRTPAGFAPQFIWIGSSVLRRAQGVFYESSTLGNFCVFFLTLIAACFTRPRAEAPASRPALLAAAAVFLGALLLSFSRASLVALGISVAVLIALQPNYRRALRAIALVAVVALSVLAVLSWLRPELLQFLGVRSLASLNLLASGDERALSGRVETWRVLTGFLMDHPAYSILGVGYKTLPYSDFVGRITVADNAYLSALVETGLFGLGSLLVMHFAILRMAWKARASLYGTWILCFWTAEAVQMLSGDLLTYWRVLPLYFWALAVAMRHTPR